MNKKSIFNDNNNCSCNNNSSENNRRSNGCHMANEHNCGCTICPQGPMGPVGPRGPIGETGPAGGLLRYADFYALMPPDNAATVAPGTDVSFPQDGPNSGTGRRYTTYFCSPYHYANWIRQSDCYFIKRHIFQLYDKMCL